MSDLSTKLQLPFLAASQAQKHVTVNESLLRLDALVQCAAESRTTTAEPGSPSDGQIYILPSGKTGSNWGAMANGALAYYRDGAWEAITPREGFLVYVKDTDVLARFDGAGWIIDYETGTFTPTITFATPGNLSVSYTTQFGRYVRVRDHVHVQGRVACTPTFTTAAGELRMAGLPFTSVNGANDRCSANISAITGIAYGANDRQVYSNIPSNVTYISFGMSGNGVAARVIAPTDTTSGAALNFNFAADYIKA